MYAIRSISRVLSSTAIYLDPGLLLGSSHLLGTAGPASSPTHGVAPDRVYSTPMFPWGGCALTAPFHPYLAGTSHMVGTQNEAVSLCCTCPRVTPGGRYPLSLPCGARTFLTGGLSASPRGCPTWLRGHCTAFPGNCQSFSPAVHDCRPPGEGRGAAAPVSFSGTCLLTKNLLMRLACRQLSAQAEGT